MKCESCGKQISGPVATITCSGITHTYHPEYGCLENLIRKGWEEKQRLIEAGFLCRYYYQGGVGESVHFCGEIAQKDGVCAKHRSLTCSHSGCTNLATKNCGRPIDGGEACQQHVCDTHKHCPDH